MATVGILFTGWNSGSETEPRAQGHTARKSRARPRGQTWRHGLGWLRTGGGEGLGSGVRRRGRPRDELALASVHAVCFTCVFWLLCGLFPGALSWRFTPLPPACWSSALGRGITRPVTPDARHSWEGTLTGSSPPWAAFGETLQSRQCTPDPDRPGGLLEAGPSVRAVL